MRYDTIGRDYARRRRPDPRIARAVMSALGGAQSVINVGAGTGASGPHDCADGFLGAYRRRPTAYLDDPVRGSISTFARIGRVSTRLERLRADLEGGRRALKNAELLGLEELDVGYRPVVSRRPA